MPDTKLPSVQEHAQEIMKNLRKGEEQTTTDPNAKAAADVMPSFSRGTVALDDKGRPVTDRAELPEFSDQTVAAPADTETTGKAGEKPKAETEEKPETKPVVKPEDLPDRDAQGKFIKETIEGGTQEGTSPETGETQQQAAGAKAADEAAQKLIDEEYEDWEFEDPDLSRDGTIVKIPLKYPKKFATQIKRGYPRRADYDRLRTRLGEAEPTLRPLLENGSIKQILPVLEFALQNQEYGNLMWQAYERAQKGLPLIDVPRETRPVQQEQQIQPGQEQFIDPLLESQLNPLRTELQTLQQERATERAQREENARRQQAQTVQLQAKANRLMQAHQDLAQMYPGKFNTTLGANDPGWMQATKYANEYGYNVSFEDPRAAVIFGAQAWLQDEAERVAATASPAATALNSVNERTVEMARQEAARAASAVGGAGTQAVSPPPKPKVPSRVNADGSLKDARTHLLEMAAYNESVRKGAA